MGQTVVQAAIIGQQQQTLGLIVEPADREDPWLGGHELDHRGASCGVVGRGDHAARYRAGVPDSELDGYRGRILGFVVEDDRADLCVGCGLCQTRCYGINVKEKGLLDASAIVIEAGEGKEDRLMTGSYVERRESSQANGNAVTTEDSQPDLPATETPAEDPFGIDSPF